MTLVRPPRVPRSIVGAVLVGAMLGSSACQAVPRTSRLLAYAPVRKGDAEPEGVRWTRHWTFGDLGLRDPLDVPIHLEEVHPIEILVAGNWTVGFKLAAATTARLREALEKVPEIVLVYEGQPCWLIDAEHRLTGGYFLNWSMREEDAFALAEKLRGKE